MCFNQILLQSLSSKGFYIPLPLSPPNSIHSLNPACPLSAAKCTYVWGHPVDHGQSARSLIQEANWYSPSPSSHGLSIVPQLGTEHFKPLHYSCWHFGWLDLVRIHVCQQTCYVGKILFHQSPYYLWILQSFCPLLHDNFLNLYRRRYDTDISFRVGYSSVSLFFNL